MIFGFNTDIKYGETVYHVQSEVREHDKLLQTQVFVKGRCLGKHATSFSERAGQPGFTEDHLHDLLKAQHKHFVDCARAGSIEEEIESERDVASEPPAPAASMPGGAAVPTFSVTPPAEDPPEEERISISLTDDPDLAAIAAASAAAIADSEHTTPPPLRVEEVPKETVATRQDPVLDSFMAELEAAEKEPPPPPLQQYRVEPAGSVVGKGIGLDCLEPIVAPDGSNVLLNVQVSEQGSPLQEAQITCRISMNTGPAAYVYSMSNASGIADLRIDTGHLGATTGILIQASLHGRSASRKFMLKRA